MSDINRKRAFVAGLYPHRGWEKKVAKMSDAQVVAIYLREQNKSQNTSTSTEENTDDGGKIPF